MVVRARHGSSVYEACFACSDCLAMAKRGGTARARRSPAISRDGRATYTADEVARLLGVGRDTVYEAANRAEIPGALRIGRRLVFARATVLAWLGNPASSD